MNNQSLFDEPSSEHSELLVMSLNVMAGITAGVGTLAGAGVLSQLALRGELDLQPLLECLSWVLAGWVTACVLWSISWAVRLLASWRVRQATATNEAPHAPRLDELAFWTAGERAKHEMAKRQQALLQRIADEMAELREDLSLSPEERSARAERRRKEQLEQSVSEINAAITAGQFVVAGERLEHLSRAMPEAEELAGLHDRLAEARLEAEARRLARARATVGELMSMSAFDRAIIETEDLLRELPDSEQAAELVEYVQREAETFARQRRQKLYLQVTRATELHQWVAALDAARQLVRLHPGSVEASEVLMQMDLLTENARIAEARERRDRILDMIKHRRYGMAVELAEDVVAHYPDTQAAKELKEQMDRLRKLAAKEA